MATMDLSLPIPKERFDVIHAIQDRSKYELSGWTPEFDVVFEDMLDRKKQEALVVVQSAFRKTSAICNARRRDVFTALGGVWDPLDPKHDQVAHDMVCGKIREFEAYLVRLGGAPFEDTQRDGANELKLAILRGEKNVSQSRGPGIAIRLTAKGESVIVADRERPKLLPGTSTFLYLPDGGYTLDNDDIIFSESSSGRHLRLKKEDVVTIKPIYPIGIDARKALELHHYYSSALWHNPIHLPNGEPNKFHTEAFLKTVRDEGLEDMLASSKDPLFPKY